MKWFKVQINVEGIVKVKKNIEAATPYGALTWCWTNLLNPEERDKVSRVLVQHI